MHRALPRTRAAAVAGTFYPAEPSQLDAELSTFLHDPELQAAERSRRPPKALIAPHAGYVYSGPIAGRAYRTLRDAAGRIRRVVLLGPAHRVPIRGLAVPSTIAFETPLGDVRVDQQAVEALLALPQVQVSDRAHEEEHCLEVQLPFLQRTLRDFRIVPIVVGAATPEEVEQVLDVLWGGPETLVVVSSDLSHYESYAVAQQMDAATTRSIERLDPSSVGQDSACGRVPIQALLLAAKRRGLTASTLDLRSSGDTSGRRDRVVGYGAYAFT